MIKSPVRAILDAIDAAARCWSDACFPARMRASQAVTERTGYSQPMVEYALDRLFGEVRRDALASVIEDELGSLGTLDEFTPRGGRPPARALAIGRVCIVSSRTTIGVAILPAIFALCAKCEIVVKDREDHLVAAFFETLSAELPELRDFALAQTWHGDVDAVGLSNFDAVVAFGSDATIQKIGEHVRPPARFIGYGSRASAGYVTREVLNGERAAQRIARNAARDLALYESEGCLSLHALFVEEGGVVSVEGFTQALVEALREFAREFGEPNAEHRAPRNSPRHRALSP
ncbi:MAG TPA: acyl-CoA reductase [Candidatus Nitrosotalea sp.]|nr:acyl-CoA reductase [Candidatus Nitrosotalea sp.]